MMHLWNAQPIDGVALKIELDEHGRLVTHHPSLVSRLHGNKLRSLILDDAAIRESDVDLAVSHEPDMRVHAEFRTDDTP